MLSVHCIKCGPLALQELPNEPTCTSFGLVPASVQEGSLQVSAAEGGGGEGRRRREGEGNRREKEVGAWRGTGRGSGPEWPIPPIAVAVSADQSVFVQ